MCPNGAAATRFPPTRQYRLRAVKSRVGLRALVAVDMTVDLAQRDSKK
jgi:hypothetical protein